MVDLTKADPARLKLLVKVCRHAALAEANKTSGQRVRWLNEAEMIEDGFRIWLDGIVARGEEMPPLFRRKAA